MNASSQIVDSSCSSPYVVHYGRNSSRFEHSRSNNTSTSNITLSSNASVQCGGAAGNTSSSGGGGGDNSITTRVASAWAAATASAQSAKNDKVPSIKQSKPATSNGSGAVSFKQLQSKLKFEDLERLLLFAPKTTSQSTRVDLSQSMTLSSVMLETNNGKQPVDAHSSGRIGGTPSAAATVASGSTPLSFHHRKNGSSIPSLSSSSSSK